MAASERDSRETWVPLQHEAGHAVLPGIAIMTGGKPYLTARI